MPQAIKDNIPEKILPVYVEHKKTLQLLKNPQEEYSWSEETLWYGTWITKYENGSYKNRIRLTRKYNFARDFTGNGLLDTHEVINREKNINIKSYQVKHGATFKQILQSLNGPENMCLTQKQIVNILRKELPTTGRNYFLYNCYNDNRNEQDIGKIAMIQVRFAQGTTYIAEMLPYLTRTKLRKTDTIWLRST